MAALTALSNVVKHWRDGSITLLDGTGTPLSLTARFSTGDFSISGLKAKLRDTTAYQARGTVTSIRHGNRNFPSISFTCQIAEFSETGTGTIMDFITAKSGSPFASRVSTRGSSAEVFTCDVKITVEGSDHGDTSDGTFTAEDVELSFDFSEGEPNTITLNGTVYGAISGDLVIATT
jgi:hypothetical protein